MGSQRNQTAEFLGELLYRCRNGRALWKAATAEVLEETSAQKDVDRLLTYADTYHRIIRPRLTGQAGQGDVRDRLHETEAQRLDPVDWTPDASGSGQRGQYLTDDGAERLAYRTVAYWSLGLPVSPQFETALKGEDPDATAID